MGGGYHLCCISFHHVKCILRSTCTEVVPDVCSASLWNVSLSLSLWTCTRWILCCLIAMHITLWFTQKTRLDRLIDSDISIQLIAALSINRLNSRIVTTLVFLSSPRPIAHFDLRTIPNMFRSFFSKKMQDKNSFRMTWKFFGLSSDQSVGWYCWPFELAHEKRGSVIFSKPTFLPHLGALTVRSLAKNTERKKSNAPQSYSSNILQTAQIGSMARLHIAISQNRYVQHYSFFLVAGSFVKKKTKWNHRRVRKKYMRRCFSVGFISGRNGMMVLLRWARTSYCNPLLFRLRTFFGEKKIRRFGTEKISVAREGSRQFWTSSCIRQPWAEI